MGRRPARRAHLSRAPRLDGLAWHWLPYTPSGLPLARRIKRFLAWNAATVVVLGNHGLVAGANTIADLDRLLENVRCRLSVPSRPVRPADYSVLSRICADSHWVLPEDVGVHCLSIDRISREILAKGLIYPCQSMFEDCDSAISPGDPRIDDSSCPFLLIKDAGLLLNRSAGPVENAMLSGLARVLQRIPADAPIRYLKDGEIAALAAVDVPIPRTRRHERRRLKMTSSDPLPNPLRRDHQVFE